MLAEPQRGAKKIQNKNRKRSPILRRDSGEMGRGAVWRGEGVGRGVRPAVRPCVPGVPSSEATPRWFPDGGNKHGHSGLVLNVNGVISAISPPRRGNLFWPIKPGEAMPC